MNNDNILVCQFCNNQILFSPIKAIYLLADSEKCSSGKICQPLQSAEFYVNSSSFETVYQTKNYRVVRNGDMRINFKDSIFRYTDDFPKTVYLDSALEEKIYDSKLWTVIDNPWFEVWSKNNSDDESPVFDYLNDAIIYAERNEVQLRIADYLHISNALDEAMEQILIAREI